MTNKLDIFMVISVALIVTLVLVFITVNIFSTLPTPNELLVQFEKEHFGDKEIIVASSINSGDVEINIGLSEFVNFSRDKTIYRTEVVLFEGRVYHYFEEGGDGELVEYSTIIRFKVPIEASKRGWHEY